jgi:hypothetical protein
VGCDFEDNRAQVGSAVFVNTASHVYVRGNRFSFNRAEFGPDLFLASGGTSSGCDNVGLEDPALTDSCMGSYGERRTHSFFTGVLTVSLLAYLLG